MVECVCFWVICTELSSGGAYGEIKGLGEGDDDERERERKRWMMDSLAKAQYPLKERDSGSVCVCECVWVWVSEKVGEIQLLEIFFHPIRIILTTHPLCSVPLRRRPCYRSNLCRDPVTVAAGCCLAWCRRGDKDCRPDAQLSGRINLVAGL